MPSYLRLTLVTTLYLSLLACGGGGGGGGSGPVASTDSFPAATALQNQTVNGYVQSFTVTGTQTVSGTTYNVSGTGTITVLAASSSSFEGQAALLNDETVSGTLTVNGASAPFSTTTQVYSTPGYAPFGLVVLSPPNQPSAAEYCVMQGTPIIPTTVKVGDSGAIGTYNCWSDSFKTTPIGTGQLSYVVEADTAHTAIVNLTEKDYDSTSTLTLTDQRRWRIDTNGNLTWVSETATGPSFSYVFK
ncbi:MAG: hypothetical protein WBX11_01840 [Thiobacillaceae bacterium]